MKGRRQIARRAVVGALGLLGVSLLAPPSGASGLSLGECLEIALENNLDLVSARITPQISEQAITSADAAFDPSLTVTGSYADISQEVTQISQPETITSTDLSTTLSQPLKFGGDVSIQLDVSETDLSGDPFFFSASRTNTADLSLNATIPLLEGRGREVVTERLLLAKTELTISNEELRQQTELVIEQVEGAYWDVLAAQAALRVARESLQRAEDLLEQNRKKVEVGTLAPIEITQAEAGVAGEVEGVIVAETTLGNARDALLQLMAVPQGDPRWGSELVLTDQPDFSLPDLDLEALIADALARRPEMSTARLRIRNDELSERVAKRGLRHGLDLSLSYSPEGTDADVALRDPFTGDPIVNPATGLPFLITTANPGDAFKELSDLDNRTWSVGLTYRLPIARRAARASYRTAQLSTEQSRVALDSQEQAIRVEVRSAVRAVESGSKRVEAANKNVDLQREKLEAEQKKFENGMSTSFEVLTFQNDLSSAELSRIQALLDFTKALAALERVRGALLEARGLRLDARAAD